MKANYPVLGRSSGIKYFCENSYYSTVAHGKYGLKTQDGVFHTNTVLIRIRLRQGQPYSCAMCDFCLHINTDKWCHGYQTIFRSLYAVFSSCTALRTRYLRSTYTYMYWDRMGSLTSRVQVRKYFEWSHEYTLTEALKIKLFSHTISDGRSDWYSHSKTHARDCCGQHIHVTCETYGRTEALALGFLCFHNVFRYFFAPFFLKFQLGNNFMLALQVLPAWYRFPHTHTNTRICTLDDCVANKQVQRLHALQTVISFLPIYRLRHPDNSLCLNMNKMLFSGWKYSK